MAVVIKAYLKLNLHNPEMEVRRIPISLTSSDSNTGIFNETEARVRSAFPALMALRNWNLALNWIDADGDLITMSSDEEMMEAISQSQNVPLKVYIAIKDRKVTEPEKAEPTQANRSQDPKPSENKPNNHQREGPFGIVWPFMGPMGMPFPPPYDCNFDPMNFYNASGRGRSDCHNPRGHFGFQFGQQNPRGYNFDNLGPRGHHFGSMGPCGQHFMPTGPHSQHFGPMGPQGQSFGPIGRGGHFPGPFGQQGPHFNYSGGHGHHFGPHGFPGHRGDHHFGQFMGINGPFESHHFFEDQAPCSFVCHEEKHEESNWKAKLRDAVPVADRRWTKLYIRNWRVQNLKNATASSSDSELERTIKSPSMREAYSAWLDIFLPKWHKCQAKLDVDVSKDTETDSEERKKLKASVPLEFRKWVKWYLARRFGNKDASKEETIDKLHKKAFKMYFFAVSEHMDKLHKKALKMHTLAASVPAEHRVWAEKFIADWRQEHNFLYPGAGNVEILLENETAEKETGDGSGTVSEYYAKWMHSFLAEWHLWRGQIDGQNGDAVAGEKGEFKDKVPKTFRKWVKCFMYRKYNKRVEKEANTFDAYQKCLQTSQLFRLAEHAKEGNIDDLVLTSSDEEPRASPSSGVAGSLATLLKKIHNKQNGAKKNVQSSFSTRIEKAYNDDAAMSGSDIEVTDSEQHDGGIRIFQREFYEDADEEDEE